MKYTYEEFMKAYALYDSVAEAYGYCISMLNTALNNKDAEARLWHDAEMGFYIQMNVTFNETDEADVYEATASDGRTECFDTEGCTGLISGAVTALWTDYENVAYYARAIYNYLGVEEIDFKP